MMTLEDIRQNQDLVNSIDWDMTPEEAVTLYLEWGNNWSHGRMVKSKKDVSYYFVIYTWINPPKLSNNWIISLTINNLLVRQTNKILRVPSNPKVRYLVPLYEIVNLRL